MKHARRVKQETRTIELVGGVVRVTSELRLSKKVLDRYALIAIVQRSTLLEEVVAMCEGSFLSSEKVGPDGDFTAFGATLNEACHPFWERWSNAQFGALLFERLVGSYWVNACDTWPELEKRIREAEAEEPQEVIEQVVEVAKLLCRCSSAAAKKAIRMYRTLDFK